MRGRYGGVATVLVAVTAVAGCGSTDRSGASSGTSSAQAVQRSTAARSTVASAPSEFFADAIWFADPRVGWAIGRANCAQVTCELMMVTHDGGRNWQPVTPPRADYSGLGEVAFADATDGWVLARNAVDDRASALYVTRDAGRSWARVAVPTPEHVLVSGGHVWVTTTTAHGFELYSAPLTSNVYTPVAAVAGTRLAAGGGEVLAWHDRPQLTITPEPSALTVIDGGLVTQRRLRAARS